MADPQYNSKYSDLGYTHYPVKVDKRSGLVADGYNAYLLRNSDYVPGTAATDANYVKAEDIAAIQDGVIAIQRVLGVNPQGVFQTVEERLDDVATSLQGLDISALDLRYGGTYFDGVTVKPTIISHTHSGAVDGSNHPIAPSKINLASEVSGKLINSNIQLDSTQTGALTGANIKVSTTDSKTIATKFDDMFNKTAANTVTGNTTFTANVTSTTNIEYDCKNMTGVTSVADSATWSGNSGRIAANTSTVAKAAFKLRYGSFVASIRAKVASNASTGTVFSVRVSAETSGAATVYKTVAIAGNYFNASNTYQQVFVAFDHKSVTNGTDDVIIEIVPTGTNPQIDLDSLIIMPVGAAAWVLE